jgi:uncharacterized protein YcfJ
MHIMIMKKQIITATALALVAAGTAQAQAQQVADDEAVGIEPHFVFTKSVSDCGGNYSPTAASNNWFAQALGAIAGGGAGSQIGKGRGNSAAAAIGAVLGAQAGAAMSGSGNSSSTPAPTCRQVVERELNGYTIYTSGGRKVFVPIELVRDLAGGAAGGAL